jgi:hypothetical protein
MTVEYVIWGRAPGSDSETLLISEHFGLESRDHAERIAGKLVAEHGCTAIRIQAFDPECDPETVAAMWR